MSDRPYAKTVLVTDGAGLVGSAWIRLPIGEATCRVLNIELLVQAADHTNHIVTGSP